MTPLELTQEYIFAHDLRTASATIYLAATKALVKHFGAVDVEAIDHRAILGWRRKVLENGLSKRSWNTYSNHLRTIWGYGLEHGILTHTSINPFKKTTVIPPKRPSKTVAGDAIQRARSWLTSLVDQEQCTGDRSKITPAWFWLATFEMFYYTGIRLNALLCLRYKDIDWDKQMVLVRGETEKTHREFSVPIMEGLAPHLRRLLDEAKGAGFTPEDQLFNVNRFSRHYHRKEMNIDQVEAMYRKLTDKIGVRMTPHRFRHTLATDLMKQPERNIHLTKSLLNHTNIATTMNYIEADYDHMRAVLHERSLAQGALKHVRRVDSSGAIPQPTNDQEQRLHREPANQAVQQIEHLTSNRQPCESGQMPTAPTDRSAMPLEFSSVDSAPPLPPGELFETNMLFTLIANMQRQPSFSRRSSGTAGGFGQTANARASP